MDTNKLRHFKTVLKTRNLREAAELLHISHPGLSKSIKSLEDEIGIKLVVRDGRGLRITKAGEIFGSNIERILNEERLLIDSVCETEQQERMNIRIGTFEVFSTYLAPALIESFTKSTKVHFEELIPGEIEQEIVNGNIDYGISYLPIPHPKLDHLKVTTIDMGVFANQKLKDKKHEFSKLPFVVPSQKIEGTPTKARGLDGWPDDRFPRKRQFTVTLMETALALSRKGIAVGYYPKFVVQQHNNLVKAQYKLHELPLPPKINNRQAVYLIKAKHSEEGEVAKKISKALRNL